MEQIVLMVHVIIAIAITGLILMQQGKGADMGASFGGGSSQTLFGSSGSGNLLTKLTTLLVVLFFVSSLALAVFAKQKVNDSVMDVPVVVESPIVEDDLPAAINEANIGEALNDADIPAALETAPVESNEELPTLP